MASNICLHLSRYQILKFTSKCKCFSEHRHTHAHSLNFKIEYRKKNEQFISEIPFFLIISSVFYRVCRLRKKYNSYKCKIVFKTIQLIKR